MAQKFRYFLQRARTTGSHVTRNFAFLNFLKSARYDDVLTIIVSLKKKPLVKIDFDYEIINQNHEKISTGNSVLAFMDMKTNKPIKCPSYILEKLDL